MARMAASILVALSTVGLGSCKDVKNDEDTSAIIKEMRTENEKLRTQLNEVDEKLRNLHVDVFLLKFQEQKRTRAHFDTSEKGFSRINHDLGHFFVSFQNVQPFGDGQKVTLHLGNPLDVTFANVELLVEWSARVDWDKLEGEALENAKKAWEATKHSKKIKLTKEIQAGSWNPVDFVIAPAPSDKFGSFTVQKVDVSQVKLRR
jgi:hypothetical protein